MIHDVELDEACRETFVIKLRDLRVWPPPHHSLVTEAYCLTCLLQLIDLWNPPYRIIQRAKQS